MRTFLLLAKPTTTPSLELPPPTHTRIYRHVSASSNRLPLLNNGPPKYVQAYAYIILHIFPFIHEPVVSPMLCITNHDIKLLSSFRLNLVSHFVISYLYSQLLVYHFVISYLYSQLLVYHFVISYLYSQLLVYHFVISYLYSQLLVYHFVISYLYSQLLVYHFVISYLYSQLLVYHFVISYLY